MEDVGNKPDHLPHIQLNEDQISKLSDAELTSLLATVQRELERRPVLGSGIPEKTLEDFQEIDRSIITRGLWGKIGAGLKMHGDVLIHQEPEDYRAWPETLDYRRHEESRYLAPIFSVAELFRQSRPGDTLNGMQKKHFFARVPTTDPKYQAVDYFFWHDHKDWAKRSSGYAHTLYVMPAAQAERLEQIVRKEPDAIESFFKITADTERSPSNPQGIGRVSSDELIVLNMKELPQNSTPLQSYELQEILPKLATQLPFHSPHGVVDPTLV